jgi:capsular polysaccharide biosynthesis protein
VEDVPYGRILREGWLIILVAAIVGAGAAYGIAKLLPETYAATSSLLLQVDSNEASLFERNQFSLARIKTYPELVDSPEVINGVRRDLGLSQDEYSDRDIRRMLSAENTADTVLLAVRADAPTAKLSADMANSAARNLSTLIESTENAGNDSRYEVNLDQVLPAVEPLAPVSPQVVAITGLGLIAGFAIGAIIAVFRTTTNRRLSTISDVRRTSGLPVVGRIPRRSRVPMVRVQEQVDAEQEAAYEDAINNLSALGGTALSRFVLIGASPEGVDDGALAGFLGAYAAAGRRACVIDVRSDMPAGRNARPLGEIFGSAKRREGTLRHMTDGEHTVFAMSSKIPMATLAREVPEAVARLSREFDIVLLVTDPGASSLIESAAAGGAALVLAVKQNSTSTTDLVSLATRLRVMGVRPLGVLMTHVASRSVGVAAESWRESDRHEIVPPALGVPAVAVRSSAAQPVDAAGTPSPVDLEEPGTDADAPADTDEAEPDAVDVEAEPGDVEAEPGKAEAGAGDAEPGEADHVEHPEAEAPEAEARDDEASDDDEAVAGGSNDTASTAPEKAPTAKPAAKSHRRLPRRRASLPPVAEPETADDSGGELIAAEARDGNDRAHEGD